MPIESVMPSSHLILCRPLLLFHFTSWQIERGMVEVITDFLFLGSKITANSDCSHEIRSWLIASWQQSDDRLRQCAEKQKHYSADKYLYSQGCGFPSGHIRLWELDYKEGRTPKNWCLRTVLLEKTPESLLDSKGIKPVSLTGDQPWIFAGRTDYWCWDSSILVIWWDQTTLWKSPCCWERLKAEEEEGVRGWDGWTSSLMQWTWAWANSRRWWGTGRPGSLQSMGSQRVRQN